MDSKTNLAICFKYSKTFHPSASVGPIKSLMAIVTLFLSISPALDITVEIKSTNCTLISYLDFGGFMETFFYKKILVVFIRQYKIICSHLILCNNYIICLL